MQMERPGRQLDRGSLQAGKEIWLESKHEKH